jgi:hypothetical protein
MHHRARAVAMLMHVLILSGVVSITGMAFGWIAPFGKLWHPFGKGGRETKPFTSERTKFAIARSYYSRGKREESG